MKTCLIGYAISCFLAIHCLIASPSFCLAHTMETDFATIQNSSQENLVPIVVSVRSVRDLKVKENQTVKIGQILALRPLEPVAAPAHVSKNLDYEVQKQKQKIKDFKQLVEETKLPYLLVQHEEAKLKDLEFAAQEFRLGAINPKTPQETVYKSPINGIIKRITLMGGNDGKLNVEILIQQSEKQP